MNPSGPSRLGGHVPYLPNTYHDHFPSTSTPSSTPNSSTSSHEFTPFTHSTPLPSTFLPSYYPENRNHDQWPSQSHDRSTSYSPLINSPSNHLLEGVPLSSPPQQPPRDTSLPTYDLTPEIISRSMIAGPSMGRRPPWIPKTRAPWNELPIPIRSAYLGLSDGGGGSGAFGGISYHTSSASPSINPYPQSTFTTSPPSTSVRSHTSQGDIAYRQDATIGEPTPSSLGYPGSLYGTVPIPFEPIPPSQDTSEYAQALSIYEHLLDAIPHIQPLSSPAPQQGGQSLESLLQLSSEATSLISRGQTQSSDSLMNDGTYPIQLPSLGSPTPPAKRQSLGGGERKREGGTKCLGCGATETPEWRRGPMGPRTLCNACGLVHIKLQRKKRKAEEKAALVAANTSKVSQ